MDDLDAWIRDLRRRLEQGQLRDIPPLPLESDRQILFNGETVLRVLLADLDGLELSAPSLRDDLVYSERRRRLREEFRHLRERLGEAERVHPEPNTPEAANRRRLRESAS